MSRQITMLYPLKFEPIFKERIWGGRKLQEFFGKDLPQGLKIGESWELADLPDDKSVIVNGSLVGKTLAEAIAEYPLEITGEKDYAGAFRLLIKILDAEDVLSVQVHPDPETCRRTGRGDPKTECWYIIAAEPGACIYKGLKPGVTRQALGDAILQGSCAELLEKVIVEPGQCHFLPAGTVHAVGAGLLIAEIQTPSDTTYRLFDWNRLDDSGKSRQLHIEDGLESIHFGQSSDELAVTYEGRLVECEYFKIDKVVQLANAETAIVSGKMTVLMIIAGSGEIAAADTETVAFEKGTTLLIPAVFEGTIRFGEKTEYLAVTV